jgi:hypothetical protein
VYRIQEYSIYGAFVGFHQAVRFKAIDLKSKISGTFALQLIFFYLKVKEIEISVAKSHFDVAHSHRVAKFRRSRWHRWILLQS